MFLIVRFSAESASWLKDKFAEVIIAPSFSSDAKKKYSLTKKNLRLISLPPTRDCYGEVSLRSIDGGYLIQEEDVVEESRLESVAERAFPSDKRDLAWFGEIVCKHLKSNAIALVHTHASGYYLVGAGMGNPNRLVSTRQAIEKISCQWN